ncbi:MAG: recombinase, partial [Sphingobacteriales bacterium]
MATVSAVVYEHHKKLDGTWNVKIRIHHKKERKLIDTPHYVTVRQLDENLQIKDKRILRLLENQLDDYRLAIGRLGSKLNFMTASELGNYLANEDKEVDFIAFCTQHIEQLKTDGRSGTACNHRAVRNSLMDYFRKDSLSITEINSNMLFAYERYLKTERTHIRVNQLGKAVETKEKGMKSSGIYNHMRDLRTLFNAARLFHNNDDLGIVKIKHYPFTRYKIGSPPLTRKRNVTVEQVKMIRDCKLPNDTRVEMARDLFMLSFYLCGMNAVDIYQLDTINPVKERIEYNRSKTAGVRKDNAFISIKMINEAVPLIEKYVGKLKSRYTTYNGLNTALSKGLKELREICGVPEITFYWARHTFATLARNKCRMSKDDVALALNHVDEGH